MLTCRARQWALLPGPSSSFVSALCRSLSTQADSSHQPPQMFQLDHIRARLEHTVPLMFRERLDYTFYRKDVLYDDRIFSVQRKGLQQFMAHMGAVSVTCQFLCPHIEMEALSIVPILDDGTVRLRWRVKHVSLLRALTNPMLFKYEYRVKRLKWYDGYSIFAVDGDGLVYKVVSQTVMPDEEGSFAEKKTVTQRLAERIGVLPKPAQATSTSLTSSQCDSSK